MERLEWFDRITIELKKVEAIADVMITVDPHDLERETVARLGEIIADSAPTVAELLKKHLDA